MLRTDGLSAKPLRHGGAFDQTIMALSPHMISSVPGRAAIVSVPPAALQ
jgi:hypothetical protein